MAPGAAGLSAREQGRAEAIPALLAASRRAARGPGSGSGSSAEWAWRSDGTIEAVPAAVRPEVLARVVETYRLPPWQADLQQRVQWWRLVQVDGQWRLADEAGSAGHPSQRDVWDLGPVVLRTAERVLVVDQPGDPARTGRLLRHAELAVSAVGRRLPASSWSWSGAALFVRPADDTAAAHLAGLSGRAAVSGLAALTVGAPLHGSAHVVLVPGGVDTLADADLDLVLTHEVVHVATRPRTRAAVPLWLTEGFADWIARGDTPVRVAAPVAVNRYGGAHGQMPRLPRDADFSTGTPEDRECAYELSWLAVRGLAAEIGPFAVEALYRDVASQGSVGSALLQRGVLLSPGNGPTAAPSGGSGADKPTLQQLLGRQLRQG